MAVSKVILDGSTLLDVTNSTVNTQRILSGYVAKGADGVDVTGAYVPPTFETQAKSVTPTTTQQTVTPDSGYDGLSSVTVNAMPTGTAGTPTASKSSVSNHSVSVTPSVTNTAGYIAGGTKTGTAVTVSASELVSGTKSISASGNTDVTDYATASVPEAEASVSINSADMEFYTSGTRMWRVRPRLLVDGAGWVSQDAAGSWKSFSAVPSNTTVTPSTSAQTIGGANYMMEGAVTVAAMPTGTAGTPTATKGSVSNHSVSVTPSVTNTTGYITGGTSNGTAVTVSASELVSGSETKTANGTYDVTNLAELVVNVSGGGNEFKAMIQRTANVITELPSDITSIGNGAFYGFTTLSLTSIPSGVTDIGNYAFYNCTTLTLASIPNGVTSIGNYAFYGCQRVSFSSLPSSLTSIGSSAFYNCQGITQMNMSSARATTVSSNSFQACNHLVSVTLPNTATSTGNAAFAGCVALETVSMPSVMESIGSNTFQNCHSLSTITLPSSITSIGSNSFQYCNGLTTISCNGSIATLGSASFNGSSSYPMQLAHVSFPNATVSSLSTAFGATTAANACQQLETADIGSTSAIAANAFANCYKLGTLVLRKTDSICTLANVSAFLNTPLRGYNGLTGTVYVPSSLIASYKAASNWSTLYNDGTVTFSAIEGSEWEL